MANWLEWAVRAPESFWRDRKQARQESRVAGRFLACLYVILYAGSYALWEEPLNLLTSLFPPVLGVLTRCIAPAVFGTVFCALFWRIRGFKRGLMTAAFAFLTRLAVIIFMITELLLWGERRGQMLIFFFFARFILPPLFIGHYAALRLYHQWWKTGRV